jgi:HEAT repeat protein
MKAMTLAICVLLALGGTAFGQRQAQKTTEKPELPDVGEQVRDQLEKILQAPDGPWALAEDRAGRVRFDPAPLAERIRGDKTLATTLIPWLLNLSAGAQWDRLKERIMDTPALRAYSVLMEVGPLARPYALAAMLSEEEVRRVGREAADLLDRQGLIEVLEKGGDPAKGIAIRRLMSHKPEELEAAVRPAMAALDSQEPYVQVGGCALLGHIGRASWGAPQKLGSLLASEHEDVAVAAAEALGSFENAWLAPILMRRLVDEKRQRVQVAIISALGKQKDPLSGRPLVRLLADEREGVRGAAARALGQIRYVEATRALIRMAREDAGVQARSEAIEALGRIRDPAALDALLEGLADKHLWVRRVSIRALGQLARPEAIDPLAAVLMDSEEDGGLRREAIEAMARIPSERVIWRLIDAMEAQVHRDLPSVFHALRRLTGQDYRGDVHDWVNYRSAMQALLEKSAVAE